MKYLVLLLAASMVLASPSFGQLGFGGGASAGIGFAAFQKEISDYYGFGFAFGAHGDLNIGKYVTVRMNFDYNIFPSNKDKLKDVLPNNLVDQNGNPINKADITISGLNSSVFAISVSGLGKLPTGSAFTPYALFGFGIYILSLSDGSVTYKGQDAGQIKTGLESQTKFGLQFGAGSEFALSKLIRLYADFKYVIIFTKDSSNGYLPFTFGVTLTP
jgi:opacity protein-like surface antigen